VRGGAKCSCIFWSSRGLLLTRSTMDALYPLRPGEQDCRDFLRTGRCKYGESCKYNHPLNVESGGGLTDGGPLPSRPGEPLCHYFLKHAICKFGQTCKFDHPNGVGLHAEKGEKALGASNNVGGGVGGTGNSRAVTSSGGLVYVTNPATGTTSVQVLPQRPNEPDCIYFLRNGRCKYGSICKFHHPLPGPSQNTTIRQVGPAPTARPQVVQQGGLTYTLVPQTVTYVQQSPQRLQPIREQIHPQHQATHILLPDGQIAVILNPQSLQDVRELSAQDRPKFYLSQANGTVGSFHSMEQNRNSSNVQIHSPVLTATTTASSSNNTIGSNFDLWGTTVRVPHKSNSGGSLSLESGHQGQGDLIEQSQSQASFRTSTSSPEEFLYTQQSDNNMRDTMRSRAASLSSSAPDHTQGFYWPSNGSMTSTQAEQGPAQYGTGVRSAPGSGGVMLRSISYDFNRIPSSLAPPTSNGHRHTPPSNDEGLSMMTASLLTMIDRPLDGDITPNTTNSSYLRPPPGMMMNQVGSSSDTSYFVGGYDQTPRF